MSTKELQEYGYEIYFLDGFVYLYREHAQVGYVTAIDGGRWMTHQNLNCAPWRFISYSQRPGLVARFRMSKSSHSQDCERLTA